MLWLQVVILAIVEGLTEFIPVSSTGHLIIVGHFFNVAEDEFIRMFDVVVQFGAILAVLFLYRRTFFDAIGDIKRKEFHGKNLQILYKTAVACIPATLCGFLFYKSIKAMFSVKIVAASLIIGGMVLILTDLYIKSRSKKESRDTVKDLVALSYKQALLVGLAQCFSIIPGVSRSGSTIVGGVFANLEKNVATEFSFFLALPIISMAAMYDLYKNIEFLTTDTIPLLLLGLSVSFIFAYLSGVILIKIVKSIGLSVFAIYRIILGCTIFVIL